MIFEGEQIPAEKLPKPKGFRILVGMLKIEEKTEGGILLPTKTVEEKEYLRDIGKVLAMAPWCYRSPNFQGQILLTEREPEPWVKVGDVIAMRKYAGQKIRCKYGGESQELVFINDDEVLGEIPDTEIIDM